ncbi:RagB/SusD family nutrient uptake outer membrane protein [Polaribacter vadi]|uniref:RagB/SusD family nutrient uptake outer membrane protein n=1 Tax=Polaribacter TaxID=52959 RepID=UPI001C09454B|nr:MULTISPECIES: RagB/SusD family nutrient uptake outer membrane protein [Polaribacter]MBU3011379.1 RagB/SusD family nutrient uptake outer membrane protein [Polaribacter vadi]MDO6741191.1 RagB/SusD family nutrient uptake outer membrane protein [Polaribacter sp. 1_MG-2023]
MKNIKIIKVLIIAFLGIFTSCNDFLDEDPKGLLTPETFFQNEAEATLALNKLNEGVASAGFLFSLGTDLVVSGRITLAAAHRFGAYDFDVTDNRLKWLTQYTNIKDANLVLSSIEKSPLSDAVKGNVTAQALFFRAFQYVNLVTTYGDVPYWRDELTNLEELSLIGQTDGTLILQDMITDLDNAIKSGTLSTDTWGNNDGRPTVWAARMLKAHAHIWLKQWAEARTELLEVTANSPHQMNNDYADKYREGNEVHSEIIFGKQYLTNVLSTNNTTARPNLAADRTARAAFNEVGITNGSAAFSLRKSFADSYDDNDERKQYNVWSSHTLASNGTTIDFAYIHVPKLMRGPVPTSDPLFLEEEARNNSSAPARIFLLADAYLLLAEADFMINGGTSQVALDAINQVRGRTALPDYNSITIQDIRNERAWELVGEGYWGRKRDLIRWGILDDTVKGLPAAETAAGATAELIARAQAEADIIANAPANRYTQYPVPIDDILQSQAVGGALVQNPLWE